LLFTIAAKLLVTFLTVAILTAVTAAVMHAHGSMKEGAKEVAERRRARDARLDTGDEGRVR
jgi:hypothetical protein